MLITGDFFPSKNSKKAPPAVEIYDIRSETLNFSIEAMVSPPPATENADDLAIVSAMIFVPLEKLSNSKTPIGPFHSIVLAD